MTTTIVRTLPEAFRLAKGAHSGIATDDLTDTQMCLLEAANWMAGGDRITDRPSCASALLTSFGQSLNDAFPDDVRQRLLPLAPLIVGTKDDGLDERRGFLCLDFHIRVSTPMWLDLVPSLAGHAAALRALPQVVDQVTAVNAGVVVRLARTDAAAALGAAHDAARGAAYGAAHDAAAALGAAHDAARGAALDAAYGAAYDAAYDAVNGAALDAALDAAYDAARGAARVAAHDAAHDAAYGIFADTVTRHQDALIDLYERCCRVTA